MDTTPSKTYEPTNPITGGNISTTLPYRFEQTPQHLLVYIPFDTKPISRNMDVGFTNTQLYVRKKGSEQYIIKGDLSAPIKPNDSTWYIEDNNLVVVLEKRYKIWFSCVMKGDPEIDVGKIAVPLLDYSDLSTDQQKQIPELYKGVHETQRRKEALLKRKAEQAEKEKLEADQAVQGVTISPDAVMTTLTSQGLNTQPLKI